MCVSNSQSGFWNIIPFWKNMHGFSVSLISLFLNWLLEKLWIATKIYCTWPSMAWMAEDASSLVAKVMKPKPRDRPVSRSIITFAGRILKTTSFSIEINNHHIVKMYAWHSHHFYCLLYKHLIVIYQNEKVATIKLYKKKRTLYWFALAHYVRLRNNLQVKLIFCLILPLPEMMKN